MSKQFNPVVILNFIFLSLFSRHAFLLLGMTAGGIAAGYAIARYQRSAPAGATLPVVLWWLLGTAFYLGLLFTSIEEYRAYMSHENTVPWLIGKIAYNIGFAFFLIGLPILGMVRTRNHLREARTSAAQVSV